MSFSITRMISHTLSKDKRNSRWNGEKSPFLPSLNEVLQDKKCHKKHEIQFTIKNVSHLQQLIVFNILRWHISMFICHTSITCVFSASKSSQYESADIPSIILQIIRLQIHNCLDKYVNPWHGLSDLSHKSYDSSHEFTQSVT